ncbi:MAG: peptide deformylase [Pseudomonadota bacterium]
MAGAEHRAYVRWPDARLRAAALPVDAVDDAARALWDEMLRAMYAMPGIGLAAPQLGVGLRLAVLDASPTADSPVRLANPVLLEISEETRVQAEGSPNLPGVWAEIRRPAEVRVRFLSETGEPSERSFEGPWAQSVQHQIDHLEGRMFFDRLGPVKRQRLLEKARKLQRRSAREARG